MKKNITIFAFMAAAACLASPFESALGQQTRDQVFIGARPMAMGETFVAIADDGTAIYWNPAGLPYLRKYEINFAYANLLGVGLNNAYLSLFAPVTKRFVLGADWFRLGFDDVANDIGLEFSQNIFHFSFAYKLFENLSIGANFKYVNMDGSEDQVAVGKADGTGYDVGLLFSPSAWLGAPFDKLRFGTMIHDVTGTDVTFDNGVSDTILKRNIRYGVSFRPRNNLVVGLDVDDRWHFGAEYWLFNTLALRGGLQKDRHTSESTIFSFGLGLARNLPALERVQTNYAFIDHPASLNTNQFSAGIAFDLFPELIEIEKIEMDDVYASQYKYHSKQPIGKAYIKYTGKDGIKCDVETSISKYSAPKGFKYTTTLTPADSLLCLPIHMIFSDSIMTETETNSLIAFLTISYESGGRKRRVEATERFTLYEPGIINWTKKDAQGGILPSMPISSEILPRQKGIAQAAAFIDTRHETMNKLAHDIEKKFEADPEAAIPNEENLSRAIQIFNTLVEIGIQYQPDPENPYSLKSKAIDKIYYPVQTLERKKGDCDDTTVLFATLLECIGIPTALVAVPEHLLMMFSTGLLEQNSLKLIPNEAMYYPWRGVYWIPVETTLLDSAFLDAWHAGIKKMRTEKIEEIVSVHEAWQTYEPVSIPKKLTLELESLTDPKNQLQHRQVFQIKELAENELFMLERQVAENPNVMTLRKMLTLKYARWPWRGDRLRVAKTQFHKILAGTTSAADSFAVFNDLANIYLLQEKARLDSANSFYERALAIARRIDSSDTFGIQLNRGTFFLAAGRDSSAEMIYGMIVKDATSLRRAVTYLGIQLAAEEDSARAAPGDRKPRKRVDQEKVKKKISKGKSNRGEEVKFVRGSVPAEFSGWEIDDVFYWALKPKDDK